MHPSLRSLLAQSVAPEEGGAAAAANAPSADLGWEFGVYSDTWYGHAT